MNATKVEKNNERVYGANLSTRYINNNWQRRSCKMDNVHRAEKDYNSRIKYRMLNAEMGGILTKDCDVLR